MKGGSTLVLKSEGVVKEHQADVLGVYRMIDSYNDRPVYKQDGGENYIYYSAASSSWLVGPVDIAIIITITIIITIIITTRWVQWLGTSMAG